MPDYQHTPDTSRMGKIMIALGFVIGIGLLTLFFNERLAHQLNPNRQPASSHLSDGSVEVVLDSNRQGHYLLSGSINGTSANFLLDTGATDVAIPEAVANTAGLNYGLRSQAMTANGLVSVYNTTIDELKLGDITLHNVRASIIPAMHDDMILLGMSALRQIEFTQRGTQLTLRQPATP